MLVSLQISIPHTVRFAGLDLSKPQYPAHWHWYIHIRKSEATLLQFAVPIPVSTDLFLLKINIRLSSLTA